MSGFLTSSSKEGTARHCQSKEASVIWSHHEETRKLPGERNTVFPLIEVRSQIQAGSLTEARGLKGEYHRTNCASPVALWCIAPSVRIAAV